jgi:hypothetical protein
VIVLSITGQPITQHVPGFTIFTATVTPSGSSPFNGRLIWVQAGVICLITPQVTTGNLTVGKYRAMTNYKFRG